MTVASAGPDTARHDLYAALREAAERHDDSWLAVMDDDILLALLDAADALRALVELKDGPRDDHYRETKEAAWQAAREALAPDRVAVRAALTTPAEEAR